MKFNRDGQSFIYFDYDLGGKLAEATFPKDENGVWILDHTFVDPSLRGKGVGEKLMEAVVAAARDEGAKIKPTCPFAAAWFEKNREKVGDIIA